MRLVIGILLALLLAAAPAQAQNGPGQGGGEAGGQAAAQQQPPDTAPPTALAPLTGSDAMDSSDDKDIEAMLKSQPLPGMDRLPLKLADAVRLSLERNINVRQSLIDRAVQVYDLDLAERLFEPQPTLTGQYNYNASDETDTRGLGLSVTQNLPTNGDLTLSWNQNNLLDRTDNDVTNEATLSLTLTQPLLRNAGITVGTSEIVTARYTETGNKLSFTLQLMNNITSVQEAYWQLLLALENRKSSLMSLQSSLEIKTRNEELIKAGRMAAADLVQTEQEVAQQRVAVLEQEFSLEQANRTLTRLLDLAENVAVIPVEGLVYRPVKVDYDQLVKLAMAHQPSVRQAKLSLKEAELQLELAQAAALDQVDLQLSTSKTGTASAAADALDDAANLGEGWAAGLSISIPLGLPRDQLKQSVRSAKAYVAKTKLDLHQTTLDVRQEVRNRVNDVTRSLRQIRLAQMSRELAQRKYKIEVTRLEMGRSTNFQVLSYQRDLFNARNSEHQAIVSYLTSLAQLEQSVGSTLNTWNVKVFNPVAPKPPSINLKGLSKDPSAPGIRAGAPIRVETDSVLGDMESGGGPKVDQRQQPQAPAQPQGGQ